MKRAVRAAAFSSSAILLSAIPAFAQENQPSPADSPTGVIFRWIIFAIIVIGLAWGFRKASPAFRRNADEISTKIAEGTRAREAAEKQRAEAQAKLAGIETEIARIREEAKRGTAEEAVRLRETARNEAALIEKAAHAEIGASERAARMELKAAAARLAVEKAEDLLRKEMTPGTEATLVRTFVSELEGGRN
jgi:F0F1-type ATP synthase membrane subunit b/b'